MFLRTLCEGYLGGGPVNVVPQSSERCVIRPLSPSGGADGVWNHPESEALKNVQIARWGD